MRRQDGSDLGLFEPEEDSFANGGATELVVVAREHILEGVPSLGEGSLHGRHDVVVMENLSDVLDDDDAAVNVARADDRTVQRARQREQTAEAQRRREAALARAAADNAAAALALAEDARPKAVCARAGACKRIERRVRGVSNRAHLTTLPCAVQRGLQKHMPCSCNATCR